MSLLKKALAECIGTAVLVFVACGVAVLTGNWLAISFTFGLVIVAMAYSIGNVSGCHINPAVSLAMFLRKKMTFDEFLTYVCAQIIGAFAGSILLGALLRDFSTLGGNTIQVTLKNSDLNLDAWSYIGAFLVEIVLTFIFVMTILGVTDSKFHDGKHAGLVIGGSLTLVHLIGLGFTGTSVNPARSFAPAILQAFGKNTTSLKQAWIWILAPLCGAALAALVYGLLTDSKEKAEEAPAEEAAEEAPVEEKAEAEE